MTANGNDICFSVETRNRMKLLMNMICFETILDLCDFKGKLTKTLAREANVIVHLKSFKKDLPLKESHRGTS